MKKHYTRIEVAKRWKCHRSTVDFRIKQGDLKEVKFMNKWKIHIDDILLVEEVKPVKPRAYVPRPRKQKPQAVTVPMTVEVTLWSKIKKYLYDLFIR